MELIYKILSEISITAVLQLFTLIIAADFITGVLVAAKNGKLKSRTCAHGLYRTSGEIIILLMAICLTKIIPEYTNEVKILIIGFIVKECISLIENFNGLGIGWLDWSKKYLNDYSDKEENKDSVS